jgi:hypothetical protein
VPQEDGLVLPADTEIPPSGTLASRWYRYVTFEKGIQVFLLEGAGGARLWVDNLLLIDSWESRAGAFWRAIPLSAGEHLVRLEYIQRTETPSLRLRWAPANTRPTVFFPLLWKR